MTALTPDLIERAVTGACVQRGENPAQPTSDAMAAALMGLYALAGGQCDLTFDLAAQAAERAARYACWRTEARESLIGEAA